MDNTLQLIEEAILSTFIEFNLDEGRTSEDHRAVNYDFATSSGLAEVEWIKLTAKRRNELLADIAWHMAERGVDIIDLSNLPPRILLEYRIGGDALERDLRSQTVFELASDPHPSKATDSNGSSFVHFMLRDPDCRDENVGESSVSGSYFLTSYLLSHLLDPGPFGNLQSSVRLRYLGRLALGPMGAAMLSEKLSAAGEDISRRFGKEAWQLLVGLANKGAYQVFSPSYRHLVSNLSLIGGLSPDEAQLLNPWQGDISEIVRGPLHEAIAGHEMTLIPPPPLGLLSSPFLLGVHEITNDEYRQFIESEPLPKQNDSTVTGAEWSVERVTVAGSGNEESRSPNHLLTNEYHLFFWLPLAGSSSNRDSPAGRRGNSTYLPPAAKRDHPVTYVSWYAAAAFCDWLSLGDGLTRHYKTTMQQELGLKSPDSVERKLDATGYRLPTRSEWVWAAKGGHEAMQQPWQAYPYYLTEANDTSGYQKHADNEDNAELTKYRRYQDIMKVVLLGMEKQVREVLYDEPNDYGVCGLMGNVREWCHDSAKEEIERIISGATGSLGEETFNFKYKTSLYPRNTNPDVGFRIARSLRPGDIDVLQRREIEIASLAAKL